MKEFRVDIDITMSKSFFVDAENEDDARKQVKEMVEKEPYYHAGRADAFVKSEIFDCYSTDE